MLTRLRRITRSALLLLQALLLAACSQASQPSIAVPGSVVSLVPPAGFTPAPPFRLLDSLSGSAVALTAGELDTDPEGRQPMIVVASQLSLPFASNDPQKVSDQLIAGSVRIQGGTITSRENVPFGGITGHRVDGVTPDGRHYRHYLALWPGERFVRLVAILPADSSKEVEDAVEATAASVRFREP